MRASDLRRGALCAAALLALLLASPTFAEEDPEQPGDSGAEEAADPVPVDAAEARRIATLLDRASKRRKVAEVMPAFEELADRSHPSFVKPLTKMLKHQSSEVAIRAAQALGVQRPESGKAKKKIQKGMWKAGWTDRSNKRRYTVQGAIVLAVGKLEGEALDDVRFKDVRRMWQSVHGDPNKSLAPAIVFVCEYVRMMKDKRFCRLLAEAIDQPEATAVNSPSNPPQEWWERRYHLWRETKAEVVETLEELTGESFTSTQGAKEWFKANEKEFGFRW